MSRYYSRTCHRVSDFRARDHAHARQTTSDITTSGTGHPSPPSFADTIKSEVGKKITDELQRRLSRKKNAAPEPPPTGSAIPKKSIAVLPFVNMSADKSDEYLSDGMTEELVNALTKVKGLSVPGRSSSFAFKGNNEEDIFRKVGEQLHVSAVLEGSVRKAGDKLRITAQLINVADGFHLWSETYDRDMKDIFAVQSDVAKRVVQALEVQLGVDDERALAKKPTENPEAHRLYLLGRYHSQIHASWLDQRDPLL